MQSLGLVIVTKLKNVSEQLRLLVMGGPSLKVITQDYTENYYCPEEVTECHHYRAMLKPTTQQLRLRRGIFQAGEESLQAAVQHQT